MELFGNMKSLVRKLFWPLVALLILAVGGYFLTYGHCFLVLPKVRKPSGETIEIRDYENFAVPPETKTFSGTLARARWRFTCPGQVRIVEAFRISKEVDEDQSLGLQHAMEHYGYEFPHGCFATMETFHARLRIAHYPTVLNRLQKDFNLRLVSGHLRTDLIDPGPLFQKTFEQVDRIEFVILGTDTDKHPYNVLAVENREDVRRFFEILEFVPYDKGSSTQCECDGDELVRAYRGDALVGEFTIHHGQKVRWPSLGTDVILTPDSIETLETYLDTIVYGKPEPGKILKKQAPVLSHPPMKVPDNNHVEIDKAEPAPAHDSKPK